MAVKTQKPTAQQKLVEKYLFEHIWKDKKGRRRESGLTGTSTFTDQKGAIQTLYRYSIAPWDTVRNAYIIFTVNILVDAQDQILDRAVYDARGDKIEPPIVTEAVVDAYLKRTSDYDTRKNNLNPNVTKSR